MKKKICLLLVLLVLAVLLTGLLKQRVEITQEIKQVKLPDNLEEYLLESEAEVSNLKSKTEKKIIWANDSREKTDLAIIYLHGFSATRQETAPLADELADKLEANLFYTRLTGHGKSGSELNNAELNDWLNDTWEAFEIGKELGEEVVVIGSSTGATLATWLALEEEIDQLAALILLSPNYAVQNPLAGLASSSLFRMFEPLLANWEHDFTEVNKKHGQYWTKEYPLTATFSMFDLIELVKQANLENIDLPVQILYSPDDQVVKPEKIKEVFKLFTSQQKELLAINDVGDPSNHVLAGDILSPVNTELIKEQILQFLAEID